MKVITEAMLRSMTISALNPPPIKIAPDTLLTAAARDYIREQHLEVVFLAHPNPRDNTAADMARMGQEDSKGIKYPGSCGKPEYMTHLRAGELVHKSHPRIQFRGKMDSLQSAILGVQLIAAEKNMGRLVMDLSMLLKHARDILRAEVMEVSPEPEMILGMPEDELRRASHSPAKIFGLSHILPSYEMGAILVALNQLRTLVREAELSAIKALSIPSAESWREDIIRALNRFSSAVYILMLREVSDNDRRG